METHLSDLWFVIATMLTVTMPQVKGQLYIDLVPQQLSQTLNSLGVPCTTIDTRGMLEVCGNEVGENSHLLVACPPCRGLEFLVNCISASNASRGCVTSVGQNLDTIVKAAYAAMFITQPSCDAVRQHATLLNECSASVSLRLPVWTVPTEVTKCSVQCGGGIQTITRHCIDAISGAQTSGMCQGQTTLNTSCNTHRCAEECVNDRGNYFGNKNQTISGRSCQRWDQHFPHSQGCHEALDDSDKDHNYCRNPITTGSCRSEQPWCYTTDRNVRWEHCDIPRCDRVNSCEMPLGMENGNITDAQITASDSRSDGPPHHARLNFNGAWLSYGRSNAFLKIDLGSLHTITKLHVQGAPIQVSYSFLRSIKVVWSSEGYSWHVYSTSSSHFPDVLPANRGYYDTTPIIFNPPITNARFIAVIPYSHSSIGLRLEVFGCPSGSPSPSVTNVTTDIRTDTRWDLVNSPFIVYNSIQIVRGSTLTIQAGVQVVFMSRSSGLVVNGCLQTEAVVPGLDIHFQSNSPMSLFLRTTLWQGITLTNSECNPIVLEGIWISNAENALYLTTPKSVIFSRLNLHLNNYGIQHLSSTPHLNTSLIDGSTFSDNYVSVNFRPSGNLVVSDSRFMHHDGGLYFTVYNGVTANITLNKTYFSSAGYDVLVQNVRGVNMTVYESSFHGSSNAIRFYCNYHQNRQCDLLIMGSFFRDTNIYVNFGSRASGSFEAVNSTLSHRSSLYKTPLEVYSSGNTDLKLAFRNFSMLNARYPLRIQASNASFTMEHSQFLHNFRDALQIIHTTNGLHSISIHNNSFIGNQRAIIVSGSSSLPIFTLFKDNSFVNNTGASIYFESVCKSSANISGNCFLNPLAPYDIHLLLPRSCNPYEDFTTHAFRNWFPTDARHRIYDFFKDLDRIEVFLFENYLDASCSLKQAQTEAREFKASDGSEPIGGRITGDWIITKSGIMQQTDDVSQVTAEITRATYYVNQTIHVPSGSSLKIRDNVTLVFYNNTGILAEGTLEIEGSFRSPILLQRDYNNYRISNWGGIIYQKAQNSSISHCEIKGAAIAIVADMTSLVITDSSFTNSLQAGLRSVGANKIDIVRSSFDNNRNGIQMNSAATLTVTNSSFGGNRNSVFLEGTDGKAFFRNTLFSESTEYGLYSNRFSGQLLFTNCSFIHIQRRPYRTLYILRSSAVSNMSVHIEDSSFTGRSRYAHFFTDSWNELMTITVLNSRFFISDGRLFWYRQSISRSGQDYLNFSGNVIESSSTSDVMFIEHYRYSSSKILVSIIYNNSFINCRGRVIAMTFPRIIRTPSFDDLIDIKKNMITGSSVSTAVIHITNRYYHPTILIRNNTFLNNTSPVVVRCEWPSCNLLFNLFQNPTSSSDLQLIEQVGHWRLYATLNWWGSNEKSSVKSRISFPDIGSSSVQFEPYLTSNDSHATFSSLEAKQFFRSAYQIGGIVEDDIVLDSTSQAYEVVEHIVISFGKTLTVEEGVTLHFRTAGISAKGRLQCLGTKNKPVIMEPYDDNEVFTGVFLVNTYSGLARRVYIYQEGGLLEAWNDNKWYSVCFETSKSRQTFSQVACHQLGFDNSEAVLEAFTCSSGNDTDGTGMNCSEYVSRTSGLSVWCTGSELSLQECRLYVRTCYYGFSRLTCAPKRTENELNNKIVRISSSALTRQQSLGFAENKTLLFSEQGAWFQLVQPGLTGNNGTVSLMALQKPGWFVKLTTSKLGNDLKLEARGNPSSDRLYAESATFALHKDRFVKDTFAFEASGLIGYFLIPSFSGAPTFIRINETNAEIDGERASFRFQEVGSSKRKKRSIPSPVLMSKLHHTVIKKPQNGLNVRGPPALMANVRVSGSSSHGLKYEGHLLTPLILRNLTITNSQGAGIYIRLANTFQSIIEIANSTVNNSETTGIDMSGPGNFTVVSTAILNSNRKGMAVTSSSNNVFDTSLQLFKLQVIGNAYTGIEASYFDAVSLMHSNVSLNSRGGVALHGYYYSSPQTKVSIVNNTFYKNVNARALDIYSWQLNQMMVGNNTFNENSGDCLGLSLSSCHNCSIFNNVFVNNARRTHCLYFTGQSIHNLSVTENFFLNPSASYEAFLTLPFSADRMLDLGFNEWGVYSFAGIMNRIHAFNKDITRTYVNIWPYKNGSQLIDESEDTTFDVISGSSLTAVEINRTLVLPNTNSTYFATGNILIREGGNLVLQAGATLSFPDNMGIRLQGNITVENQEGNSGATIDVYGQTYHRWYGIILDVLPYPTQYIPGLKDVNISNSQYGITLHNAKYNLTNIKLTSDQRNGVQMNGNGPYFFQNCSFHNLYRGIYVASSRRVNITVISSLFSGNSYDIQVRASSEMKVHNSSFTGTQQRVISLDDVSNAKVTIEGCIFAQTQQPLVTSLSGSNTVRIINNTIKDSPSSNSPAVTFYIRNANGTRVIVSHNLFSRIRGRAFYADDLYGYGQYWHDVQFNIQNNIFTEVTCTAIDIPKVYYDYANFTIFNNSFLHNSQPSCSLLRLFSRNVDVVLNHFEGNSAISLIDVEHFKLYTQLAPRNNVTISSNTFSRNVLSTGFIQTRSFEIEVTFNIFPSDFSHYFVFVDTSANERINATYNWWGTTNVSVISGLIYDRLDDGTRALAVYEPYLSTPEFSCERLSNCSQRGYCIRPNVCECNSGWKGQDCSQVSCAGVNDCYSNGQCVGPNTCSCNSGWREPRCDLASCDLVNECSGRGVCISPQTCQCSRQYTGRNCTECAVGYWGEQCEPCPKCVNGQCNAITGGCTCYDVNWGGDLCDQCSYKFYGPRCLPLLTPLQLAPTRGPDVGGTQLQVSGHNFPQTGTYICRFGNTNIPGRWVSEERVVCTTPQYSAGRVVVKISSGPGQNFYGNLIFTFDALCPASACGSQKNPPHGICAMGSCICRLPWTGDDCSELGLPPVISRPDSQLLRLSESQFFQLSLSASEGSEPLEWNVQRKPASMQFSSVSASFTWSAAQASLTPYPIAVQCRNAYGEDRISFELSVPPAYYAVLNPVDEGPYASLPFILLGGRITFNDSDSPLHGQSVPVTIRVAVPKSASYRTLSANTFPGTNTFFIRYYHSDLDSGLFQAGAHHPRDTSFSAQTSWRIHGIQLITRQRSLNGYIDPHVFSSLLCIKNTGATPLTDVTLPQWQIPYDALLSTNNSSLTEESVSCLVNTAECQVVSILLPDAVVCLDLHLTVHQAFNGFFYAVVTTSETVNDRSYIGYNFRRRKPYFTFSSDLISATVTRGKTYTYQVNVTNTGLRPATNVKALIPNERMVSLVSFSKAAARTANGTLVLNQGESALLVLRVSPSTDQAIGDVFGTIVIRSVEISKPIRYRFVVASTDRLDFTVYVEDEYTYFAENRPRLSGARVRLVSQYNRGRSLTLVTNDTGMVIFENITEDYYTLYASADDHVGERRVLLITPSSNEDTVFLQRVAVTYSWTVTPVVYEDRYEITLEADFETFVPAPVVTLEPLSLDLEPLEEGLQPVINFVMKNHGLIAAEGVTFTLPLSDDHPFLRFEMDELALGRLPANTTWNIPVRVIVLQDEKQRYLKSLETGISKRGAGSTIRCLALSIAALYYYICDRERYNNIQASLRKSCRGRPGTDGPGGGGAWRSSGVISGSGGPVYGSSSPAVTSSLTCDEIINCYKGARKCFDTAKQTSKCVKTARNCFVVVAANPEPVSKVVIGVTCGIYLAYKCHDVYDNWKECHDRVKRCIAAASGSSRRKRSILTKEDLAPELGVRYEAVEDFFLLAQLSVGDNDWIGVNGTLWLTTAVLPVLTDSSAGGPLITANEYSQIVSYPLPPGVTRAMADTLLSRINNTVFGWDQGNLEGDGIISHSEYTSITSSIIDKAAIARAAGFDNVLDWYEDGYDVYDAADEDRSKGVCAKVRVQIQQRLAITREAFSARLEVENGESDRLTNIKVEIIITNSETQELSTSMFAIGDPEVSGMSDVDGSGVLNTRTEGSAEWLIIPYTDAAPFSTVDHDIGGVLYYTVNGNNITVPLFPDTVTVTPDPRLHLNYFWERDVESDDALTPDIVEPTVPFTLGLLISNVGYGTANNMRITSGQPEIIENEKGLLVDFMIIGTQLGSQSVQPSLSLNIGDLQPMTTAVARWIMTTSLKGTFSNFSATFENINPLGDPKLSVMETISIHALLHVVLVDTPASDGIPDFLVFSETLFDKLLPDRIYVSHDGTNPLNVSHGNITDVVLSSSKLLEVSVLAPDSGWVYFRTPISLDSTFDITQVMRSDGHQVNENYNLWIDSVNDVMLLQMIDYFDGSDSAYSYDVTLTKANLFSPTFTQTEYYVNVSESALRGHQLVVATADDGDADQSITYNILSNNDLFNVHSKGGGVSLIADLDREVRDEFSVLITATDDGTPQRSTTAVVQINVLDVNDNSPILSLDSNNITLENNVPIGYIITSFSVSDDDADDNGLVDVVLENTFGLPININQSSGTITITDRVLDMTGTNSIRMAASDRGRPPRSSSQLLTINLVQPNDFDPVFNQSEITFSIFEDVPINTAIGQVIATDEDKGNTVITYMIESVSAQLPFRVSSSSGMLFSTGTIDREQLSTYSFVVRATDNGAQPRGRRSSSTRVNIIVQDINDNKPSLVESSYTLRESENAPRGSVLFEAQAFDVDEGVNALIADIKLVPAVEHFILIADGSNVTLVTREELDRETTDKYTFRVRITDSGIPPLANEVQFTVIVEDVNDNAPYFQSDIRVVMITRFTPVNTQVFVLQANDTDITGNLRYSIEEDVDFLSVNAETGSLRLRKSLSDVTWLAYNVTAVVTDGVFRDSIILQFSMVTENLHAPNFDSTVYSASIAESAVSGASITQVQAFDDDGQTLSYSIISGNRDNTFTIDPTTGEVQLLGSLDFESRSYYTLGLQVSDGGLDGTSILTGQAVLHVNVTDENEFTPVFSPLSGVYTARVSEGVMAMNILQVIASDDDTQQSVTFTIQGNQSHVILDRTSGWLSVVQPFDREVSSSYSVFTIAADNGVPVKSSVAEVRIQVSDINDNAPVFSPTEVNVSRTVDSLEQGSTIYTAQATDADDGMNAQVQYRLSSNPNSLFAISDRGVITLNDVREGSYAIVVVATDSGIPPLSSVLTIRVDIIGSGETATLTFSTSPLATVASTASIQTSEGAIQTTTRSTATATTAALDTTKGSTEVTTSSQRTSTTTGITLPASTIGATTEMTTGVTAGVTTGVTTEVTTGVTAEVTAGVTTGVTAGVTTGVTRGVTTEVTTGVTAETTAETLETTPVLTTTTTMTPTTSRTTTPPACDKPSRFSCDMEEENTSGKVCFITQLCTDDLDWSRLSGRTRSAKFNPDRIINGQSAPRTGPERAHEGRYYMYVEASNTKRSQTARASVQGSDFDLSGGGCFEFYYMMNGEHIGDLALYMKSDSGEKQLWSTTGDQSHVWKHTLVNVTSQGPSEVIIQAEMKGGFAGDIAVDSVKMSNQNCNQVSQQSTTASPVTDTTPTPCNKPGPFSCDAEDLTTSNTNCFLVQHCGDTFDWTRHRGETPSSNMNQRRIIQGTRYPVTGPQRAIQGSYYMYVEATGTNQMDSARITVKGDDFNFVGEGCLRFSYIMNGQHIGTLNLYMKTPTGEQLLWSENGDKLYVWNVASIDVLSSGQTEFILEAVMAGGFAGDTAFDDVGISHQRCNGDVQTTSMPIVPTTSISCNKPGPISCDAEDSVTTDSNCFLVQQCVDNLDWTRHSGKTPSANFNQDRSFNGATIPITGPERASQGSYYLYVEASGTNRLDTARVTLTGDDFNFVGEGCLRFSYMMNGQHIGTLNLYTKTATGEQLIWSENGDKYHVWNVATNDVSSTGQTEFILEAVMAGGFAGDIAFDDVRISHQRCNGVSTTAIPCNKPGPFSCDAEDSVTTDTNCFLVQECTEKLDWTRHQGKTLSAIANQERMINGMPYPITGPDRANQGDYYLYVEASGTNRLDTARISVRGDDFNFSGEACLRFSYMMNGQHSGMLNLYKKSVSGEELLWSEKGDKYHVWNVASFAISSAEPLEFVLEVVMTGQFAGDIAVDNIRFLHHKCSDETTAEPTSMATGISSDSPSATTALTGEVTLWECSFENADNTSTLCGMQQDSADNFDWTLSSGGTLSQNTGPTSAHSLPYYIYIEASSPRVQNDVARIFSPRLSIPASGKVQVQFAYHMFGRHIGNLSLFTRSPQNVDITQWHMSGGQGNKWHRQKITLENVLSQSLIGYAAMRGEEFAGDIAIDDIKIFLDGDILTTSTTTTTTTTTTITTSSSCNKTDKFSCDFEEITTATNCFFAQDCSDDFDWTRQSGKTPTSVHGTRRVDNVLIPVTGPENAYNGMYYVYVEATGRKKDDFARIILQGTDIDNVGESCLKFYYMMNGQHIGELNVYKRNGTETLVWSTSGDQLMVWNTAAINVTLEGQAEFVFEAVMTGEYAGDIALDGVQFKPNACEDLIWQCNFENADNTSTLCGMQQDSADNFDWTLSSGGTRSQNTGPTSAHSLPYYIYIEASSPRVQNDVARILSGQLNLQSTGSICVQFTYHMHGRHTGSLALFTRSPQNVDTPFWQLSDEQGNMWHKHEVTLSNVTDQTMVGFAGTRGEEFAGDIAIDDVKVLRGTC